MASIAAQTTVAPGRTGSRLRAVVKGAREAPLVAIVILGGLILVAVFADLIAPHDPTMRVTDAWLALPAIVFAIFLAAMVGPSMWNIVVILGAVYWTRYARVIRGEVLTLREREFVKLAEIAGASRWRVIKRHILPNVMNTATVLASLTVGVVIIAEASLSFLGVGVPPPEPAWGLMLSEARPTLMAGQWWLTVFPGACILLIVLATQLFGDWLRVRLDPQLRNL